MSILHTLRALSVESKTLPSLRPRVSYASLSFSRRSSQNHTCRLQEILQVTRLLSGAQHNRGRWMILFEFMSFGVDFVQGSIEKLFIVDEVLRKLVYI